AQSPECSSTSPDIATVNERGAAFVVDWPGLGEGGPGVVTLSASPGWPVGPGAGVDGPAEPGGVPTGCGCAPGWSPDEHPATARAQTRAAARRRRNTFICRRH